MYSWNNLFMATCINQTIYLCCNLFMKQRTNKVSFFYFFHNYLLFFFFLHFVVVPFSFYFFFLLLLLFLPPSLLLLVLLLFFCVLYMELQSNKNFNLPLWISSILTLCLDWYLLPGKLPLWNKTWGFNPLSPCS